MEELVSESRKVGTEKLRRNSSKKMSSVVWGKTLRCPSCHKDKWLDALVPHPLLAALHEIRRWLWLKSPYQVLNSRDCLKNSWAEFVHLRNTSYISYLLDPVQNDLRNDTKIRNELCRRCICHHVGGILELRLRWMKNIVILSSRTKGGRILVCSREASKASFK